MTPVAAASAAPERSQAFVAAHLDAAIALGRRAGGEGQDPAAIAQTLLDGLPELADAEGLEGVRRVAPAIG